MFRLVLAGALLLHGLGHGGAIAALAWIGHFGDGHTGDWHAARSWLLPDLQNPAATLAASGFWVASLAGFVVAALAFLGVLPPELWRPIAVVSALISIAGIVLFAGTWPAFNTLAALGMNVAVLVAILVLGWPDEASIRG